jgi:pimeloyl-ACP methyl ester carboxylesterase
MSMNFENAATKSVDVNGTNFVYREVGKKGGIPLVFLHHLTAVLEDWDPRIVDGLAAKHHVIVFDNRGGRWIRRFYPKNSRGDGSGCRRVHRCSRF